MAPAKQAAPEELLQILLGALRALRWNYQTSHWQVKGKDFYGDHLLFQRMYEAIDAEIDGLAEKIVGYYGIAPVESVSQAGWVTSFLRSWGVYECPYHRGLHGEKELQRLLKSFYDKLKGMDALSLGMDDYLMATASAHEANLYLLGQKIARDHDKRMASMSALREAQAMAPSAEGMFFNNPERREVREFQESGQISNITKGEQRRGAPPTVREIENQPGGKEFSTLNRHVVETEEPTSLNPSREPSPKLAGWSFLEK